MPHTKEPFSNPASNVHCTAKLLFIYAHPDDESFGVAGLARMYAALRAHRTQHLSIDRHFFDRPDVQRSLSIEVFPHGFGPKLARRPAADILEGM